MKRIIDPDRPLTFSDYYYLKATDAEIAEYFGYRLERTYLPVPEALEANVLQAAQEVQQQLIDVLPYFNLDNETARREVFIAPLLFQLIKLLHPQAIIEYYLEVSHQLKGTVDYYLKSQSSQVLIIEAKLADTEKGFKQLIAQLIALQEREELSANITGVVTTGQTWHFGILNPEQKVIYRDLNFYSQPKETATLLSLLIKALTNP